jgi:hypothetical protein
MMLAMSKNMRKRKEIDGGEGGSFMAWYDEGGMTYPSRGGVELTVQTMDAIVSAMDPECSKHDSKLCRTVVSTVIKNEPLVYKWKACIDWAGVGSPSMAMMAKYWKRFVGLLVHARFRQFLNQLKNKSQHGDLRPSLK